MSLPSRWPLPEGSYRWLAAKQTIEQFLISKLSQSLYPLACGFYKRAANHRMIRQTPDDYLLIYCIEGKATLTLSKQVVSINAGDLIVLPKLIPHAYYADEKTPWSLYWCHFDGGHAADYLQDIALQQPSCCLHIGINQSLIDHFEQFTHASRESYHQAGSVYCAKSLQTLLSYIAIVQQVTPNTEALLDVDGIHAFMAQNLSAKLELTRLARQVNLSKYHFIKKYKAQMGTTPINYFIHLKVRRACELLDSSELTVKQIAYALGYEDPYYFSRVFKKVLGTSPKAYRHMRSSGLVM